MWIYNNSNKKKNNLISEAWVNILKCQLLTSDITCSTAFFIVADICLSIHVFPFRCGFRTDGQRNVGWSSSVPLALGAMLFSEDQGGWGRWVADLTSLISLALGDTATMEVWEKKEPPSIHFPFPVYSHNQLSFIHRTKAYFSGNAQITDPLPHLEMTKDSPSPYSLLFPSPSLTYSPPTHPPTHLIPSFLSISFFPIKNVYYRDCSTDWNLKAQTFHEQHL